MNRVLIPNLCEARRIAASATSCGTPSSSKRMRADLTTATHSSGLPLPLPMRVSSGFLVIGLSGKTRIHTLPPRLTWREMAIRPPSIFRALTPPVSTAWGGEGVPPRLDLPRRAPAGLQGLEGVIAESDVVAPLGHSGAPAALLLPELDLLRH